MPDILNKYFARSTWMIFTFPSLNAIFGKRVEKLPHGSQQALADNVG